MSSMARNFLKSVLLAILMSSIVWGQTSTASISGAVVDQSGAVLPGVEITVTQTETGVTRMAVTNDDAADASSTKRPRRHG